MLTTEEAARRLGVKVPTLYAYVSRGLLESHPDPSRRGSLFDLDEIEALAARSRGGRQTATRLATITTGVTQLDQRLGPIYRGRAATDLAPTSSFEEVAELLWQSEEAGDWTAPDLGPCPLTPTLERMRWALVMCGATDPLRADLRPAAVARAARRATAALTDVVGPAPRGGRTRAPPSRRGSPPASTPSAAAVPTGRRERRPHPHGRPRARHLDHGRAGGRVGPLRSLRRAVGRAGHPGRAAARWREPAGLRAAGRGRARRRAAGAERRARASAAGCPASGTPSTRTGTPASTRSLTLAEPLLSEERRAILHEVIALAAAHDVPLANCDLALAALSWGTGMPPDTGRTLFAVARLVGLGGPLHGGADGAAPALPGPGRLQRLSRPAAAAGRVNPRR